MASADFFFFLPSFVPVPVEAGVPVVVVDSPAKLPPANIAVDGVVGVFGSAGPVGVVLMTVLEERVEFQE